MDEEAIKAFALHVETSLTTPDGKKRLHHAHEMLVNELQNGSFNSDRAKEIYMMTIERSAEPVYVKVLRDSGITDKMASELVDQFKQTTGAADQRATRTGILAKLVGK